MDSPEDRQERLWLCRVCNALSLICTAMKKGDETGTKTGSETGTGTKTGSETGTGTGTGRGNRPASTIVDYILQK
jgi:hypothetical protein